MLPEPITDMREMKDRRHGDVTANNWLFMTKMFSTNKKWKEVAKYTEEKTLSKENLHKHQEYTKISAKVSIYVI